MLNRHRVSPVACTLGTSKTALELGNSSDDARSTRRDFALLKKAFDQQVTEILGQAQSRLSESDRDFQRATEEHSRQEEVLRDENADLQRQLEDYRLANRQLEDRLRGGTFKVSRVMNFPNRHNARVSGNWPHLKALLEKFKDGSLASDTCNTQIQTNAADEFDVDPGAYEYEVERDDEESKATPAKIQRKLFSGSKLKALTDFQLRPSVYAPSMTDTLDLTTAKQLSVTKALSRKKLLDDRIDAGLEETFRDEPGSWTIPAKCCHVERDIQGGHQPLSVVIPVGLIHLGDICPNTPNDRTDLSCPHLLLDDIRV
ncbi:hypothetical protein PHMEG_0003224 [Phytophthora megakarya]|uniref:Uncharacterized protein n=1 Tax=Phytophthora megakarya TaxID=4795 RepID=A0A225WWM3_9STRA|nr:hypothetical protein PHMEG_0003224 [Phytophthora megakarya]